MIFALLLVLIAMAGGAAATYWYDEDAPLAARLCSGTATGLAAFGFIGFIIASFVGLNNLTLMLTAIAVASPLLLLTMQRPGERFRADFALLARETRRAVSRPAWDTTGYLIFYAAVAIILWLAFDRVMFKQADGALYTGVLNNYGDLPFHLSVITSFVYGQNFPPEDPTFAGIKFTYPFIVDFVAACLVRAGASLREAMLIENFVLGLAFVGLLHRWALELVRDRLAAILTPVLILLSGGFGWLLLFNDMQKNEGGLFSVLGNPPHSYTIIPETTWRWGNSVNSLLLTQRSFLLGLPLALMVMTGWWAAINGDREKLERERLAREEEEKKRAKKKKRVEEAAQTPPASKSFFHLPGIAGPERRMVAAGIFAGFLPLVHAHSFIVVMGMGACLALLFWNWRLWAIFFIAATAIALPQLYWSTHGSSVQSGSFFGWQFGWDRGTENVFWFWLKNTGLFIPLTIAAICWRGQDKVVPRRVLLFFLPFTLCFIIPNLVRLAPWVWDNVKVLFYWWIASAPLVALFIAYLWRREGKERALAALLLVGLTLAGALDVWGIVAGKAQYQEFDRDGIAFAEMIKLRTGPRDMILHAPIHNHPVFLTGRRSLMGYPGHIWTHGLKFSDRERDIKRIYMGGPEAQQLLARYGIDYLVASPLEGMVMPINNAFFLQFEKVGETGGYQLYKVARR
ncbi:MAG TPA: hypothetical protein VGB17_05480 [Pyrinomonadaceae bacterium]|jgi:hypothetical protein